MTVRQLDAARVNAALLRQLYGPSSAELAAKLTEIGEHLESAFADLARDPTPERCEILSANLHGASRHVMRLAETIKSENTEPPRAA
jgi:hypothetical protein